MNENELYEALGLEAPAEEPEADGANAQEPAAPEAQAPGANEQETAAPAVQEDGQPESGVDVPGQTEEQEPDEEQEGGQQPKPQSAQENARNAERRRQAKLARQAQQAREQADREIETFLQAMALEDPYTGRVINTRAEMEAYRERADADRRKEFREAHNMTEEQYDAYLGSLPEVKAAREEAMRNAAENARLRMERELEEIHKLDPTVTGLEQLAALPDYQRMVQMVAGSRGAVSLADAYKAVSFDRLSAQRAQASRQAAINAVNGKQHLEATVQRGDGGYTVPDDVASLYRELMPDMSEDEMRKAYGRYRKSTSR